MGQTFLVLVDTYAKCLEAHIMSNNTSAVTTGFKESGNSLETKLSCFLFQYRLTPHTTMGVVPAEMLMGRRPKSHLDLLHPDIRARVVRPQDKQKVRQDQHAKERFFQPGNSVYIKNVATGQPWLPGVIHHHTGPVSFVVDLSDARHLCRHQDHLRVRSDTGGQEPPKRFTQGQCGQLWRL